jgi:hypothetical protein
MRCSIRRREIGRSRVAVVVVVVGLMGEEDDKVGVGMEGAVEVSTTMIVVIFCPFFSVRFRTYVGRLFGWVGDRYPAR